MDTVFYYRDRTNTHGIAIEDRTMKRQEINHNTVLLFDKTLNAEMHDKK